MGVNGDFLPQRNFNIAGNLKLLAIQKWKDHRRKPASYIESEWKRVFYFAFFKILTLEFNFSQYQVA